MPEDAWTRRRFVGGASALGTLAASRSAFGLSTVRTPGEAANQESIPPPASQGKSPEIVSGGLVPLLESNLARPLRYRAQDGAFVVRNGPQFFNRPIYGPNIPFRIDGGDRPEFSLYLPGHGGNLRLGVEHASGAQWLHQAAEITSSYVAGRLVYAIRDPLLGHSSTVHVEALTEGAGLWVEVRGEALPPDVSLLLAFGGVSGRKGRRNGDIGCEVEPVSEFFQVRPEECRGNRWTLDWHGATVDSGKIRLRVETPTASELRIVDGVRWNSGWRTLWETGGYGNTPDRPTATHDLPALAGKVALSSEPLYLKIAVLDGAVQPPAVQPPAAAATASTNISLGNSPIKTFSQRRDELAHTANSVRWHTPDAFLDGMAPALGIAADAIWDETQGCVMHGAVAWRIALAGWRGPYVLDVMGRHDRMQRHLRHWIARQNITPITDGASGTASATGFTGIVEATGHADPGSDNARTENLLHSDGDLSHNHYDMNLVCFDALLRHLRWTGDLAFAREAWPALERHAAWERRLFRRVYAGAGPLYEGYAAIWASDNLQYNGGGAAHSSAYNVFLNRQMAQLAELLGEEKAVAAAYRTEADQIAAAMRELLWMPERGAFAEGKDRLGQRTLGESPAVWTVYHTIDSEVATRKEAWQMAAERLRAIRKVPIVGDGVPPGGWQLACSDWLPYEWSLTLLCLGENLHTALALFQAGMAEQGYALLGGSLLDAGYRGLCPGNFPMSLQLDPHRQESQRDFGDPIGCAARTVAEGLWGIQPDLLAGHLTLQPQLPAAWTEAEFAHPELTLRYTRQAENESWTITSAFARPTALRLILPARTTELPAIHINGQAASVTFDQEAVGSPRILLIAPAAAAWNIEIAWHGAAPLASSLEPVVCALGQSIPMPFGVPANTVLDDPQQCLRDGRAHAPGGHTIFAAMDHGDCRYWLPIELTIREQNAKPIQLTRPQPGEHFEPIPIDALLTGQVNEIFTRSHAAPRPDTCSLNLPNGLLGGWANFDVKATINDAGLRAAGGMLPVADGLSFRTPASPDQPNCCYLSQWQQDRTHLSIQLHGRASDIYLLLACTTFPQASRSAHGTARLRYSGGGPSTDLILRSPQHWWPVEQDYLIDDYVFRMEPIGTPETPLPIRVDLQTGKVRTLDRSTFKARGRAVPGGSATVLRLACDPARDLAALDLTCDLYGVQMGLLAVTLGR
jgi:hypothetical protein